METYMFQKRLLDRRQRCPAADTEPHRRLQRVHLVAETAELQLHRRRRRLLPAAAAAAAADCFDGGFAGLGVRVLRGGDGLGGGGGGSRGFERVLGERELSADLRPDAQHL